MTCPKRRRWGTSRAAQDFVVAPKVSFRARPSGWYEQEATREYSVGAGGKIHDVGVDASASVALTKRLMLRIVLAGGRNYHLKALPDRPGLYWQY